MVGYAIPIILYSIYLFGVSPTPVDCYVSSKANLCMSQKAAEAAGGSISNMSSFWHTILLIGFIYNIVLWVCMLLGKQLQDFTGIVACVVVPDAIVTIGWYGFLWYARFCHGGRVISGSYCPEGMVCDSNSGY